MAYRVDGPFQQQAERDVGSGGIGNADGGCRGRDARRGDRGGGEHLRRIIGGEAAHGVQGSAWRSRAAATSLELQEAVTTPQFIEQLRAIVGEGLLTAPEELRTYECDGLTNLREVPAAVVIPREARQVQELVQLC